MVPLLPSEKLAVAGDVLPTVRVVTDKASYSRGERIFVTIHNELATFIYAPSDPSSCSVVSVQRFEDGKWVPKNACVTSPPSDPPSVMAIPPRSQTWGRVGDRIYGSSRILLSVTPSNRSPLKKCCARRHEPNHGSKVNHS